MNTSAAWFELFRSLGYEVQLTLEGDLTFEEDGIPFRCLPEEEDPTYLHIVLPGVWVDHDHDPDLRLRVAAIINTINGNVKVAKLILGTNGVHASVEALSPSLSVAARQIPDLLTMARVAGQMFSDALHDSDESEGWPEEEWRG